MKSFNDTSKRNDTSFGPNTTISKTIKDGKFRGPIPNSEYYIVNEIISGDNSKVFSAVKITGSKIDEKRYCVKYFSKQWIKNEVLQKLNLSSDKVAKFFDTIKKSINDYRNIKLDRVQQLIDYTDDNDGMYIVTEFCDLTLRDLIAIIREPVRNSRIPFECKIRDYIYQILAGVYELHDKYSLAFGGLLNASDIMVSETDSGGYVVRFPHPFLANLITILKIYNKESFPTHYSPEVYELFSDDQILKVIEKKDSFDMGSLLSKINQNFDMWSLGYLIFELIFENPPFEFNDLSKALSALNRDYTYKINPYMVSPNILKLINDCLQYDPQNRMHSYSLHQLKEDIKKENDNKEDFENALKERSQKSDKKGELESIKLTEHIGEKFN